MAEEQKKSGISIGGDRKAIAVFFVILLLQIALYMFLFIFAKTAHHEDEFFSYGMANSYDRPFLYGSGYSVYDNYNTWMKGADFWDYITVQKGQAFRYDTVWANQTVDTHPPLYYTLIHTISSVFAGNFSWWWAFGINLSAFIVSQVFLYRLVKNIANREVPALLVCAFWGFSVAGQNTHLFLRMYALYTMFCILFVWFLQKAREAEKTGTMRELVPLGFVVAGGALTQHLFLVFAFFLTLSVCICELWQKQWKRVLWIGGAVAAGVLLSIMIFPATLQHLFGGTGVVWHGESGIYENLRFLLILALGELTGILLHMHAGQNWWEILFVIMAFLLPAGLLFMGRSKITGAKRSRIIMPVSLYYTILCYLLLVSGQIYYGEFGMETDRYVFVLMPLMCVVAVPVLVSGAEKISERLQKGKRPGAIGVVMVVILLLVLQNNEPLFRNYIQEADPSNGSVASYLSGQNCLFMCAPILQPCFCQMLAGAEDIYVVLPYDEGYRTDVKAEDLMRLNSNGRFYLLVDTEWKQGEELLSMLQYFADQTGTSVYYCTEETTHGVRVGLYEFSR